MIGQTVSHYKILQKLGEGGMGIVYKAQDTKLLRPVALKFLSPELTRDQGAKRRFIREARAASGLDHPNIAVVHDVDETVDGRSFICMAYYEGQTLAKTLSMGSLEVDDAVRIAVQVAGGLERAHDSGIVHRDIKPSNIIITPQGEVKIVDFGLAKLSEQARETKTQVTGGTAAYMSPEQILGNEADARSDLFSLGVVLYEMVTGKRPFLGEHEAALCYSIVNSEPTPPSTIRPGISPELERIVLLLLEKDPKKRYQNASDVVIDLKHYLGEKPTARPMKQLRGALSGKYPVPVVVAGAVLIASIILYASGALQQWFGSVHIPDRPTIGLLPFENVTKDTTKQYICDGLFDRVTGGLGRLRTTLLNSRIVPASEMRSYKGKLRQACTAFGLTLVVEGSVECRPSSITVTVTLVDGDSLSVIDSRTIGPVSEASLKLEEEVLSSIAQMMRVRLRSADFMALAPGNTNDEKAYDLYLRGRSELNEYANLHKLNHAIDFFTQATIVDPRYTLAYAGLGEAYWRRYEATKAVQWVDSARVFCARARLLDSTISEVCMSLGIVYRGTGEYALALHEFNSVLAGDSLNGDAYRELGETYRMTKDTARAIEAYRKAISLRPNDWSGFNVLARFFYFANRNAEAVEMWTEVTKLRPSYGAAYSNLGALYYNREKNFGKAKEYFQLAIERDTSNYIAYSNLGTLYYYDQAFELSAKAYDNAIRIRNTNFQTWAGRAAAYQAFGSKELSREYYEKAIQLAEGNVKINARDAETRSHLAGYYVDVGRKEQGRSMLAQALALGPEDKAVLGRAAMISEQLGEREKAIRYLKHAIHNGYVPTDMDYSPEMKSLREDPRYKQITKGG
jgi:tetratricopeptide (TPR) repeat protein/TolB-like protein/tRNA A-37 threonylcarbamoyl transferase component Bud32